MAEWVHTLMAPTVLRFRAVGFDRLALTSDHALAVGRLAGRRIWLRSGLERYRLEVEPMRQWERRLAGMSAEERRRLPDLDAARVDTIVPGAVIMRTILELAGAAEAVVCATGLRDGKLADHLCGSDPGQGEHEHRPLAEVAFHRHAAPHRLDQVLDDRQS
jgi:exopolyphosphatase/pppGpp-phosphohydrolase